MVALLKPRIRVLIERQVLGTEYCAVGREVAPGIGVLTASLEEKV